MTRTISMANPVEEALKRQRERFIAKFGREPGPHDPVFFNPDKDEPTALSLIAEMRPKRPEETQTAYVIACIKYERDQEWRQWLAKVIDQIELDAAESFAPPPDRRE